ncbi:MAG: glycosyltransferase family 39 protein, partial [Rhodospirillales bacterium]|nr:glycosyltransferase family 39 protein [Rhodospirillales bacterium]
MSFLDRSLSEHTDRAKPPRHRGLNVWRDASLLVLVAVTVLVLLTFRDYGITNDEEVQNVYGKLLLEFYRSGDLAALDYLDLYRYGGLFDMLAALLNKVSPLGEYETRHLLGGLVGVLGLMGVWKLGRELAGERAGFLALMMFLLTPAFYGTSFNNPKDAPFAGAMAWTLYYMVRMAGQLPRPRLITVLKFGAAWGITLGIRVGAVLVLPYLSLAFLLYLVMVWRRNRLLLEVRAEAWRLIKLMLPAFVLAYVLMAAFWPWAAASPLNPLRALSDFSRLPLNLDTLVAGQWVKATDLPPYYLPLYLAGKLPEVILVGLLAALGMGIGWLLRPHHSEKEQRVTLQYMLVALAGFFPVIYFVLERPT